MMLEVSAPAPGVVSARRAGQAAQQSYRELSDDRCALHVRRPAPACQIFELN
jgi:hypothetical protein